MVQVVIALALWANILALTGALTVFIIIKVWPLCDVLQVLHVIELILVSKQEHLRAASYDSSPILISYTCTQRLDTLIH